MDNSWVTKSKVSDYTSGLMVVSMKAGGTRESSMDLELTIATNPDNHRKRASGRTESV